MITMWEKFRQNILKSGNKQEDETLSIKAVRAARRTSDPRETVDHLREDVRSSVLSEQTLIDLLDSIENARGELSENHQFLAARYGLRNQHGFEINDFEDALPTKNLKGMKVENSRLGRKDARNVDLSMIRVNGKKIDLLQNEVRITGENPWNIHKLAEVYVDNCSDCETYNKRILGLEDDSRYKDYLRRGIALKWEGHAIGYQKLKGERSFLAIRTVRDKNGAVIFWKGGVYAFDHLLAHELQRIATLNTASREKWLAVHAESILRMSGEQTLGLRLMRLIREERMYALFDTLANNIETGHEKTTEDLLGATPS
jgi:hypothetical protein